MRSPYSTRALLSATAAVALLAGACAPDSATDGAASDVTADQPGSDDGELSGTIEVSGSSTVEPITALNAELFQEQHPGVSISVDGPGTGDGFALFCEGQTDISDASRPIKEQEAAICADNGVEFTELKIGIDGLSILINPANDTVECVDFAALYALTGPESNGFTSWSQAADLAAELGSTHPETFPDAPLDVVGPGEESGTYDTYVELVIEEFNEDRGAEAATRSDYEASPNDNVIVQGILGSETALGWVGYAFYVENQESLKALAVDDGGSGCVAPTDDTIASGEYPLSRPLFIYVNDAEAATNPALSAFVDYYLSDEGRSAVSEVGYVQLEDGEWQATVDAAAQL
jgi:phosphate transport system substrate-binding protein